MMQRRFESVNKANPADVKALADNHPAILGMRSIFTSTVVNPSDSPNLLVSGMNNRKIGKVVTKGPWAGMPIYTLTLEERATCPASCFMLKTCLVPGTRVLTADLRWVPIDQLQAGQRIVGFDEHRPDRQRTGKGKHGRRTKIAIVEALGRAKMPCVRITTEHGVVTASADHLWIARQDLTTTAGRKRGYDWIASRDLKPGAKIAFIAKPWEQDRSYDAARLRGFVEGEGTATVSHAEKDQAKSRIAWSQKTGPLCDEIYEVAKALGFDQVKRRVKSGINGTDMTLTDINGGWRKCLEFLGRIRPSRLLSKAEAMVRNHAVDAQGSKGTVVLAVEDVGIQEVVTIQTSTSTLIAEGLCSHNCYGNAMHHARRNRHGEELEGLLGAELIDLADEHPKGFVVRLHVLGDFYSRDYVAKWGVWLEHFPQLRVYGYTARSVADGPADSREIAMAIHDLNTKFQERCFIRFSNATPLMFGATVIDREPEGAVVPEGLVCPAETQAAACCASCGLCWSPEMRDKTIVFVMHGMGASEAKQETREVTKTDAKGLRPIRPVMLAAAIKPTVGRIIEIRQVKPTNLHVDERYQRNLARKSMDLIRTMAVSWDWRKFNLPTVVEDADGKLHVIDGQHTAIAAASRQDIEMLPVKLVDADSLVDRAGTFVGINRDRITVTPNQIYYAELAAGFPEALGIKAICDQAEVTILRQPPPRNDYAAGETMAIGTLRRLYRKGGANTGARVLTILTKSKLMPITDWAIEAVYALIATKRYPQRIPDDRIAAEIKLLGRALLVQCYQLQSETSQRISLCAAEIINKAARK